MTIPGVGPVIATAVVATVGEIASFASGREFAAFFGLTPRQRSSGGKEHLGRITKMGDRLSAQASCGGRDHRVPSRKKPQRLAAPLGWGDAVAQGRTSGLQAGSSATRQQARAQVLATWALVAT